MIAATRILELEAEVERLQTANTELINAFDACEEENMKLSEENDKLKKQSRFEQIKNKSMQSWFAARDRYYKDLKEHPEDYDLKGRRITI